MLSVLFASVGGGWGGGVVGGLTLPPVGLETSHGNGRAAGSSVDSKQIKSIFIIITVYLWCPIL